MSSVFDQIQRGMEEAIAFAEGRPSKAVVHHFTALDVKAIRRQVGMTQIEFAKAFGISVSTLRHWERGDRTPQGPARVLLTLVAQAPDTILDLLRACSVR